MNRVGQCWMNSPHHPPYTYLVLKTYEFAESDRIFHDIVMTENDELSFGVVTEEFFLDDTRAAGLVRVS